MDSIYSGYLMPSTRVFEFLEEIRVDVWRGVQSRYNELVLLNAQNLLDKGLMEDRRIQELGELDGEFWDRVTKWNMTCFYSPSRMIGELLLRGNGLSKLSKKYEGRDRLIKNLSYDYLSNIFELANNRVSYRVLLQNVYRESSNRYNFSNRLILYSMGDSVVILPDGGIVEGLLREGFLVGTWDSYEIKSCGDCCPTISDCFSGDPSRGVLVLDEISSKGGIPVDLFSVNHSRMSDLGSYLKDNLKFVLNSVELPSRDTRANRYAYREVQDRYIEWSLESADHAKGDFDEFLSSEAGREWVGLYENLREYYVSSLQDLTMENLFDSLWDHMPHCQELLTMEDLKG